MRTIGKKTAEKRISAALDDLGYATMTDDLTVAFAAVGCDPPKCHIDDREIAVGERFRIKDIARSITETDEDTTASVMICNSCDIDTRRVPYRVFLIALSKAGLAENDVRQLVEIEPKPAPKTWPHSSGGCFMVRRGNRRSFGGERE